VTPNYSAGLLLIDTYYKIMQKSQQLKKGSGEEIIRQKESCWTKLARLCGDSEVIIFHSPTLLTSLFPGCR